MPSRSRMPRAIRLWLAVPLGLGAAVVTGINIHIRAESVGTSPTGSAVLAVAGGVLPIVAVCATIAAGTGSGRVRGRVALVGLLLVLGGVAGSGGVGRSSSDTDVWWAVAGAAAPMVTAVATGWALSCRMSANVVATGERRPDS